MSGDQKLIRQLWLEKRGEAPPVDLSDVMIVQLGNVTEALNLDYFEGRSGYVVTDEQAKVVSNDLPFVRATLDGIVRETPEGNALGILEAKFMFPFYWSMDNAVEKYYPQVQHNMFVTGLPHAWLSVINGAGQYEFAQIEADEFYQIKLVDIEQTFWECVESGKEPGDIQPIEHKVVDLARIDDMTSSNAWAVQAGLYLDNRDAAKSFVAAEKELKQLIAAEAKEAFGHGIRVKRAKNGNLSVSVEGEKKTRGKKAA